MLNAAPRFLAPFDHSTARSNRPKTSRNRIRSPISFGLCELRMRTKKIEPATGRERRPLTGLPLKRPPAASGRRKTRAVAFNQPRPPSARLH
jgi:hypothetical protein